MHRRKLAVTPLDPPIAELAGSTSKKTLVTWAADCAERALPYFETRHPGDTRPREAIAAGREWVRTGVFRMKDVRAVSLAAHAAAREAEEDNAARSAARAAGQAVAATHVPAHAIAAAIYAATAVRDTSTEEEAEGATLEERKWQYRHLKDLREEAVSGK